MVVGVTPFVGRAGERDQLDAVLADALGSRGSVAVLTGAAGIGKTRLADEVAGRAGDAFDVVWATCGPPGAMPPFWPWTQILGEVVRRDGGIARRAAEEWPAAAGLARSHRPAVEPASRTDPEAARAALFDDVASMLAAASQRRPLLVVVDDLHDADPSSWLLLAHVATAVRTLPVAVVATWRTGDVRAADAAATHLLRRARLVPVAPLDVQHVALLLQAGRADPVPAAVAAAVHRRTSGNPLLAHEVATLLDARGAFADPAAADQAIPDSARQLVADRLGRLSAACRDVLAVAAAAGTAFALDVVAEAAADDGGVADVLDVLGEAEAAGVLRTLGAVEGAFSHDVVRDALFDGLPASMRAALHLRVGEALERLQARGRRVEAVELARHFAEAGTAGVDRAAAYAREAGDRAMAMLAYEDAAAMYGLAVKAAGSGGPDRSWQAGLLIALGDACDAGGDRVRARGAYVLAAGEARLAGRADLLAQAALGMSGAVGFEVSLLDREQIDLLREALEVLVPDDRARRAAVMARLAVSVSFLEDEGDRRRLAEEAVALARDAGDERVLVEALAARCDAMPGPDHCAARAGTASEIVAAATRMRDLQLELLGRRLRLVALLEQGDLAAVDRDVQAFASAAALLRRPLYSWYVPLWRAMRALMEGRLDDDRASLAEAETVGALAGSANAVVLVGVHRWCLFAELEQTDEIERLVGDVRLESFPGVWPIVARALVAAQLGRLDEARVHFDAAAALLPSAERDSEWLPMMAQVAELAGLLGPHPIATWAYAVLLPYRALFVVEGIGAVVRGPVERDLGLLATVLGRPDEARSHFDAAVAAAQRLGASLLTARMLRDAGLSLGDDAMLHAARGRYQALGIDNRVPGLERRLGAPPAAPVAAGANVFRREGEIWRLAHAGREAQLRDSKGLRDLARLLSEPARPVAAVELAGAASAGPRAAVPAELHGQGDLGDVIDARARDAYRRRLQELEEEIDDADLAVDPERSARAAAEKDALVAQLTAAFGLGRRPRRAGDPAERARQTVTARIRDAMARIEAVHPDLGRHLRRSVRTGRVCVYEPDTPIDWSS